MKKLFLTLLSFTLLCTVVNAQQAKQEIYDKALTSIEALKTRDL